MRLASHNLIHLCDIPVHRTGSHYMATRFQSTSNNAENHHRSHRQSLDIPNAELKLNFVGADPVAFPPHFTSAEHQHALSGIECATETADDLR